MTSPVSSSAASPAPEPTLTLLCSGDVAPLKQPVDALADHIHPVLDSVDFRFLQCERTYSKRGAFPDWQTIPYGKWTRLDAVSYTHLTLPTICSV